jgi:hypothetical protein
MVSRVFFSLYVDGTKAGDFSADLKQVVGGKYDSGDIEVSKPLGYDGAFNHQNFSEAAKKYFLSLVGPHGSGIRITGGGNIRMRNNRFGQETRYDF